MFWKIVYITIKLVNIFILCQALFFNKMWGQFCTLTPHPLFFKSTLLKLGDTMNCYFIGKLYGMSCARFPYSMPIRQSSNMATIAFLVCDWPINLFFSKTICLNWLKFGRKHICKVLYKVSSFGPDWKTSMATMGNSCFWLAGIFYSL